MNKLVITILCLIFFASCKKPEKFAFTDDELGWFFYKPINKTNKDQFGNINQTDTLFYLLNNKDTIIGIAKARVTRYNQEDESYSEDGNLEFRLHLNDSLRINMYLTIDKHDLNISFRQYYYYFSELDKFYDIYSNDKFEVSAIIEREMSINGQSFLNVFRYDFAYDTVFFALHKGPIKFKNQYQIIEQIK